MGIKIYTYSNPYEINLESYWDEIKDSAHFCVSQTMVNGLEDVYPSLKKGGYLTTIRILLNSLYSDWEDENTRVKQIMEVDNAINNLTMDEDESGNARRSLEYNTKSLVKCIRLFKELGLSADSFDISQLNADQRYLVDIYKYISNREYTSFKFNRVTDEHNINELIIEALRNKHKEQPYQDLSKDTVVVHGIHQFSPAMLCAIEDIAKYKTVILLFNYQQQYKAIYQTWLNIYSLFDKKIVFSNEYEFKPVSLMIDSYPCNTLADNIGTLSNGELEVKTGVLNDLEVIEFENITEFAGYCALLFEKARKVNKQKGEHSPVLHDMTEQLYSASGKVNDILRAYFPEQFGERHFLDYPIGHFFVAAVEMWDNENECVKVDEMSLIKDCLESGIMQEKRHGQLLNTFNIVESYIEKETTLNGVIHGLKNLRKYVAPGDKKRQRIGFLDIAKEDLDDLRVALEELENIIMSFFKDFGNGGDNFNRFYRRIHDFIVKRTQDMASMDGEMKEVISKLLARMKKIDLPDTGTFTCLKQTMSFYLSQDDALIHGANWIVRDFEQIDGDILRSIHQKADNTCYHFCCLSDKNICSAKDERLPWPLDIKFFEYSYEPLEQNYQIFLKSKMEFKNFKRYALLYGLEFNRLGCKLSYVKSEDRKDNEIYHLIKMLGLKVRKYHNDSNSNYVPYFKYDKDKTDIIPAFKDVERIKYLMCPYKFALESIVQGKTIYRERFLVIFYLRILLKNNIHMKKKGESINEAELKKIISDEYDDLDAKFHISNEYEKTQIISGLYKYLKDELNKNSRLSNINPSYKKYLEYSEDFLMIELKEMLGKISEVNLKQVINEERWYNDSRSGNCIYCSSKDVCLKIEQ
ncbi:hypothetical protein [Ruminococcus flavefaciens]|uniref:hypothetical protein n=1 Tax=Ruminococcus flavefaciens TaxID=1265 RepID=UPI0002D28036|nr:hypothetical protein [Ruminococcus flavefaciens]